jgi:hypothetical protein
VRIIRFVSCAPYILLVSVLTAPRVCFPDCDQGKWTYNHTMERVLFKAAYRVCPACTPNGLMLRI